MARGSVTRRGDAWRVAVELAPDPITGKRRQLFETCHGLKKDADKRLTELLALADQQLLGANSKMKLGEFLERWLEDYARTKAPKTYSRYRQLVEKQIVPHLGAIRLDKVTPAHVVRLQSILRDAPRQDGRPGKLSARTIAHVHRVLHTALECAVKWRLIPRNPADGVEAPSAPRSEMRTFTVDQARAFLAASEAEGIRWQAFYHLALASGLRPGELSALRWQDLDLDASTLSVQQSVQRIAGMGRVIRQPKTAGSRRPIALDLSTVALLRKHRVDQNARRLQMGPLWQDHGLVFCSEVGTPLEHKRRHEVFTRICRRANVPRIRPYDLRHSCASLLLAAGIHPKVVAERLGHSNVNLTLNTYSHVLPTLQEDAARTLGALLQPTR